VNFNQQPPPVRQIFLPIQKSQIKTDLSELIVFIYGPKKFGKTTWCAQADNALFLCTEPGTSAVSVFETSIENWEDLYFAYNLLRAGQHQFKTIVIDTCDNAWKLCEEFICKVNNVKIIQDVPWGKGPKFALDEFYKVMMMFSYLPYGLYLTSHTTTERVESRTGTYSKIVPSLPTGKENKDGSKQDGPREIVTKLADFNLFCDFETVTVEGKIEDSRVIRCLTGKDYEGGSRYPMPPTLPLDYNVFTQAFHNSANWLIEQENQREIQRQNFKNQATA